MDGAISSGIISSPGQLPMQFGDNPGLSMVLHELPVQSIADDDTPARLYISPLLTVAAEGTPSG